MDDDTNFDLDKYLDEHQELDNQQEKEENLYFEEADYS